MWRRGRPDKPPPGIDRENDAFAEDRARLLGEIVAEAEGTAGYTGRPAFAAAVLAAIEAVPREAFVPEASRSLAYVNRPLPIGHGQTISQPYIVACMTELLDLTPEARVLEIGTGCGYQAAVLAQIAAEVHSVEVVPELHEAAAARLETLGYRNVHPHLGDGWAGWPEAAPYDAIIVTAAPAEIPAALLAQLAPGGRMAVPVGPTDGRQLLKRISKDEDGRVSEAVDLPVAFVPLVKGAE